MKYAWLAIGIFTARFLATAIAYPQLDGDLAWQRWLGALILRTHAIPHSLGDETFTAAGSPWVPQEWAFSVAAALGAGGAGWVAFAASVSLAATVALAVAAFHAERLGASARANLLCTGLAGVALFASFGVRAQVVAWPFVAIFLYLIDLEGPVAYAAVAVAALWSNLHASAMLAPVLAAAAALGTAIDEGIGSRSARRRGAIAVLAALAVCCNPFGPRLPLYAIGLFASPFKAAISEWKPTDLGDASFALGALPLLLAAFVWVAGPSERRARDTIVLAAFSYLLLAATRNVAVFGIAALPYAASALTRRIPFFAATAGDRVAAGPARVALPALSAVLAAVVAVGLLRSEARGNDGVAARAMAYVATLHGERRVFCADFAWCGLVVGSPRARVFLDGRADPYPERVWDDYLAVARLHGTWRATLDAHRVNTVVTERDTALDDALSLSRGWRTPYGDRRYRVWVRS